MKILQLLLLVLPLQLFAQSTSDSYTYKRKWWMEKKFMFYLNVTRVATLHQPLFGMPRLRKAAREHNQDQAAKGDISHFAFAQRSRKFNFRGENVIYGGETAFEMFKLWFKSDGHRQNMYDWSFFFSGLSFYEKMRVDANGRKVSEGIYGCHVFR